MSAWKNYIRNRRLIEGLADGHNPVDKFRFNAADDYAEDYEKAQTELFKTVINKYPNETYDFFDGLAKRGDSEVASFLKKIRKDKSNRLPMEPRHPTDGDEVMPPIADSGNDMNDKE